MRLKYALSAVGAATVLALAGCGGGGSGGGAAFPFIPPAGEKAPDPVVEPPVVEPPVVAPEVPAAPALVSWKDVDCAQEGAALPKCTLDFSDNDAAVTIADDDGQPAIQLKTGDTPNVTKADGPNNDVAGNLAALGLPFLHQLKLSEFPGFQYDAKGADAAAGYINLTVSVGCDGGTTPWVNLLLRSAEMTETASPDNTGYTRYSATPASVAWLASSTLKHPTDANITLLNGQASATPTPLSLDALMAAYPAACIFNFGNPVANGITPTPAATFKLGDSTNATAQSYLIKGITSPAAN